jgi:alanyl-tRNA synthetase
MKDRIVKKVQNVCGGTHGRREGQIKKIKGRAYD